MGCIVVGVTAGIAAYKVVEVVRQLALRGLDVRVAMTEHATQLVGPATFRAISGKPVALSLFEQGHGPMQHISLSHEADLIVVAPATANIIAKMANGIADDLLSTILLATRAPVLIAPAMNDQMYSHPSTQENLRKLRERGVQVAGPASGPLACGREGLGRMVEPQEIVDRALGLLGLHGKLDGMKVLVTAGGTREPLDPVRFIGNRSSGKMGYALARVARAMGAEVDLVSGPSDLERPPRIETVEVETAQQMQEEVLARAKECRVIVMAAAVADYAPAEAKPYKIKKLDREDMRIDLKRTPDILEALGRDKAPGQVLVGFAAETEDLVENARQKLQAKNLDLIVANDVSGKESGFESDYNLAILLFSDGRRRDLPLMPKEDLAALVWDEIAGLLQGA